MSDWDDEPTTNSKNSQAGRGLGNTNQWGDKDPAPRAKEEVAAWSDEDEGNTGRGYSGGNRDSDNYRGRRDVDEGGYRGRRNDNDDLPYTNNLRVPVDFNTEVVAKLIKQLNVGSYNGPRKARKLRDYLLVCFKQYVSKEWIALEKVNQEVAKSKTRTLREAVVLYDFIIEKINRFLESDNNNVEIGGIADKLKQLQTGLECTHHSSSRQQMEISPVKSPMVRVAEKEISQSPISLESTTLRCSSAQAVESFIIPRPAKRSLMTMMDLDASDTSITAETGSTKKRRGVLDIYKKAFKTFEHARLLGCDNIEMQSKTTITEYCERRLFERLTRCHGVISSNLVHFREPMAVQQFNVQDLHIELPWPQMPSSSVLWQSQQSVSFNYSSCFVGKKEVQQQQEMRNLINKRGSSLVNMPRQLQQERLHSEPSIWGRLTSQNLIHDKDDSLGTMALSSHQSTPAIFHDGLPLPTSHNTASDEEATPIPLPLPAELLDIDIPEEEDTTPMLVRPRQLSATTPLQSYRPQLAAIREEQDGRRTMARILAMSDSPPVPPSDAFLVTEQSHTALTPTQSAYRPELSAIREEQEAHSTIATDNSATPLFRDTDIVIPETQTANRTETSRDWSSVFRPRSEIVRYNGLCLPMSKAKRIIFLPHKVKQPTNSQTNVIEFMADLLQELPLVEKSTTETTGNAGQPATDIVVDAGTFPLIVETPLKQQFTTVALEQFLMQAPEKAKVTSVQIIHGLPTEDNLEAVPPLYYGQQFADNQTLNNVEHSSDQHQITDVRPIDLMLPLSSLSLPENNTVDAFATPQTVHVLETPATYPIDQVHERNLTWISESSSEVCLEKRSAIQCPPVGNTNEFFKDRREDLNYIVQHESDDRRGGGGYNRDSRGDRGDRGDRGGERRRFNRDNGDGDMNNNDEVGEDGEKKAREFYIPPEPSNDETEIFSSGISSGINFSKYDHIPVKVTGDNVPQPIKAFSEASLRGVIMENVVKSGYKVPTPIQKISIPIIANNRDMMACAQTGSGKTAAFLLPILNNILDENNDLEIGKPEAVIVSPTRELAIQIYNEARKFSFSSYLKISIVYGGTSVKHQNEAITRGCHVLIATPGRLLDFVDRTFITFNHTRFVVLDEADRMLDMGFSDSMRKIMNHQTMRAEHQTLMFSATFPEEIQRMAGEFLKDYIFVTIGVVGGACSDVQQNLFEVNKFNKRSKLMEILREGADGTIVFVETKRGADFLASFFSETEFPTTSIHGDRLQSQREQALRDFKSGKMKVLIATSVASRGLDIKNVKHVINYDMPSSIDDYVHRIGRTGRVGNNGRATSFFDPEQDRAIAGDLIKILEGAKQPVPEFLKDFGVSYSYAGSKFGGVDVRGGNGNNNAIGAHLEEEQEWD